MKITPVYSLIFIIIAAVSCSQQPQEVLETPTQVVETPSKPSPTDTPGIPASNTPQPVNPRIEIALSAESLKVGDILTVSGEVFDLGLPIYRLVAWENGASEPVVLAQIDYNGKIVSGTGSVTSSYLAVESIEAGMHQAVFVLHAENPGRIRLAIQASGEIHEGYPGPAYWGGASSDTVEVEIFP